MNLRLPMLVLALLSAIAQAQTTASSQAVTSPSANGSTPGAAPTRANGRPPSEPGLNTATSANATPGGSAAPSGSAAGNTANRTPAPAATEKVEVIGRPAQQRTGSVDRPLLPIVTPGNALGIRSGTPIVVTLRQAVDSGHARNGDMLNGRLAKPLASLPAGTAVRLTVVAATPAGQLTSYGALSLQVVAIGDKPVLSDTITALGKEGAKELPDAAPARGTEAIFTPDQPISLPAA